MKLSIRDLWGKRTEKKALNPDMRDMLLSLDGVYEPRASTEAQPGRDRDEHVEEPRETAQ
jgi:hypothetical protein